MNDQNILLLQEIVLMVPTYHNELSLICCLFIKVTNKTQFVLLTISQYSQKYKIISLCSDKKLHFFKSQYDI